MSALPEILDSASLEENEAIIARGIAAFVEVGQALQRIREGRQYLSTHETFEDYCRERWGMDRTYAHRQIQAAEIVATLPIGNTPHTESVARELTPLRDQPNTLRQTWAEVIELHGEKPTAAQVREVVQQHQAPLKAVPITYCPTCGHRVRADKPLRPRGGTRA